MNHALFASTGEVVPIIVVSLLFGGWIVVAVAKTIATSWQRAKESEHLAVIKQQMLERGMSADEIIRVVNAGIPPSKS